MHCSTAWFSEGSQRWWSGLHWCLQQVHRNWSATTLRPLTDWGTDTGHGPGPGPGLRGNTLILSWLTNSVTHRLTCCRNIQSAQFEGFSFWPQVEYVIIASLFDPAGLWVWTQDEFNWLQWTWSLTSESISLFVFLRYDVHRLNTPRSHLSPDKPVQPVIASQTELVKDSQTFELSFPSLADLKTSSFW